MTTRQQWTDAKVWQTQDINNTNDPQKKYRLGTVSKYFLLDYLNQFHRAPTSPSVKMWMLKPRYINLGPCCEKTWHCCMRSPKLYTSLRIWQVLSSPYYGICDNLTFSMHHFNNLASLCIWVGSNKYYMYLDRSRNDRFQASSPIHIMSRAMVPYPSPWRHSI